MIPIEVYNGIKIQIYKETPIEGKSRKGEICTGEIGVFVEQLDAQ